MEEQELKEVVNYLRKCAEDSKKALQETYDFAPGIVEIARREGVRLTYDEWLTLYKAVEAAKK